MHKWDLVTASYEVRPAGQYGTADSVIAIGIWPETLARRYDAERRYHPVRRG